MNRCKTCNRVHAYVDLDDTETVENCEDLRLEREKVGERYMNARWHDTTSSTMREERQ